MRPLNWYIIKIYTLLTPPIDKLKDLNTVSNIQ